MDRRDFLSRFGKPVAVLAAVPVVVAAADKAQEATTAAIRRLKHQFSVVQEQCSSVQGRMDKLEARQKKMMRLVLAAAAVTVGVDISLLL